MGKESGSIPTIVSGKMAGVMFYIYRHTYGSATSIFEVTSALKSRSRCCETGALHGDLFRNMETASVVVNE